MNINLRYIYIVLAIFICGNIHSQNFENGLYVSHNGGIISKYAILIVQDDTATMEMFTKWQGFWLPAIGTWDEAYKPQVLQRIGCILTNENIRVEKRMNDKIIGVAKNTYMGKMKFKFKIVDKLPERYSIVRNKSIDFTKREKNNPNIK